MSEPTRPGPRPSVCGTPCAGLCREDGVALTYREHRTRLLARARATLGDHESAEDAVREAFLRAWRACGSFDPPAGPSLSAWLTTITRHVVIDMVRDRPYAGVAAELDLPAGTVKSRAFHAMRGLRRALGPSGRLA